ncbi:hypothetical protein EXIGLDRAFT_230089 [Exidia glandulosa HHB12029]|uniref:Uncharacterized protein n=1 Tax=Exidia glandulosa HHB12029 TaxID=1314781 RepID=A0A165E6T2_EXIGL|nr:hypothetical protein EXIGLDRAFT_230089 [Exidia glandulosa HHB12029]
MSNKPRRKVNQDSARRVEEKLDSIAAIRVNKPRAERIEHDVRRRVLSPDVNLQRIGAYIREQERKEEKSLHGKRRKERNRDCGRHGPAKETRRRRLGISFSSERGGGVHCLQQRTAVRTVVRIRDRPDPDWDDLQANRIQHVSRKCDSKNSAKLRESENPGIVFRDPWRKDFEVRNSRSRQRSLVTGLHLF